MPQAQQGMNIADSAQINAGVIQNSDIADDTILNAKINSAAAIAQSKLALAITNAEVDAAAAIADSKLAQITTASKVSGAALTSLASVPAGAGKIPGANITAVPAPILIMPNGGTNALSHATWTQWPSVPLNNAATEYVTFSFFYPTGATLSAIKVHFAMSGAQEAANVNLDFEFYSPAEGGDVTTPITDGATGQNFAANQISAGKDTLTIPATAYDGLTAGRQVILKLIRNGAAAGDTSTRLMLVTGLELTF